MSNNATKIDLYLKNATGSPRTNTRVVVKPVRAGFWADYVGLVEDGETLYQTDNNGYVQMTLWPLPYPYYLTYSDDDEAMPGQFLFYVPDVDTVVNFQDLIVTKADSTDKYADEILRQIIEAKVATMAAAAEAKESATEAKTSETNAAGYAQTSSENAENTTSDRNQIEITNANLMELYSEMLKAISIIQGIAVKGQLTLGSYTLWVDGPGRLRILQGTPVNLNTDGVVVGTQS